MKEIISYQCEHCGLQGDNKEWMEKHEKTCSYNEANRNCMTCSHYWNEEEQLDDGEYVRCWEIRDEDIIGDNPPCNDWVEGVDDA